MQTTLEYKPREAFSINLRIFTFCGHWSAGVKSRSLRYLYKLWGVLAPGICTGAFFTLQFINMVLVFGDLHKVMEACYLLVTYVGEMSKFVCLRWHARRVEKLFEELETPIFTPRRREHFAFMNEAMGIVRRDSLIFLSSGISAITFWSFYPLVDVSQGRELAYVMWCPMNLNDTAIYVGTYSFQIVVVAYNTAINTMMDTTICGLMKMMSGHLDILSLDFSTMFDENFIKPGTTLQKNTNNTAAAGRKEIIVEGDDDLAATIRSADSSAVLTNEEIHSRVVACVKYYLAIEGFVMEINRIFENGMLIQFAASCLIVCVTSFELTMAPVASIQFASIIQYQGCMIVQIFIYCWRGNELTIKFSELSTSIYNSEWMNRNRSFHRCMDVIMSRLQKPKILYLAGLISLSVDTFIAVIKSAYSFYMFLKEVSTDE